MPTDLQMETRADQPAPVRGAPVIEEERLSLLDVWRTVVKQRYVIMTITAIAFASVTIYSFRTKPIYESVVRIQINPTNAPRVGLMTEEDRAADSATALQTELLILQSDTVLLQTAQGLDLLDKIRARLRNGASETKNAATGPMTPVERKAMVNFIKGGLTVKLIASTQIIDIRYRNEDPKLAAEVANRLVDTYIDQGLQSKFERSMHVSVWLEKQLADLQRESADAQRRLVDYQRAHNIVGTDENSNLTTQTLAQISGDLETAEADRIMKEARLRDFSSEDADLVALTGDNPQVGALRTQLNDLQLQRSQMALKYGENYPHMQELNSQIGKVQAAINGEVALARRQVGNEYETALHLEQQLRKRLAGQEEQAYRLNEDIAQYAILRHEAELNRSLYDTLQVRLKESSVTAGLSATDVSVVDRAQVPFIPVAPKKALNMVFGLMGGLLAGILVAFTIESIDDRIQTSEEVESVARIASLATIPHINEARAKKTGEDEEQAGFFTHARQLISLRSPKSMAGEAYRGLRSSLLLSSIDRPPRVIVFTSAFPGEGKTTTAVNTAITLAQRGERVLLVDADLRRGSLDRIFGIEDRSFGLSTVMMKPAEQREIPAPLLELNMLHLLPTGPRPPNPAEMLSSHRMEEQIKQWLQQFDRIVLDTAPVLAVSDTQTLAATADAVVLVVRAGVTRKRALIRARDMLWRINASVAGIVVNDVDLRLENFYTYRYGMYGYNSGYRYRYGYGYGYGYSESDGDESKNETSLGRRNGKA